MSWITEIFSSSISGVVDSVGTVIDNLTTNDEERLQIKQKMLEIKTAAMIKVQEVELQYEQELTKRHSADMASDSYLSKNIRPLTLIFILGMYSLLSISSGFQFEVKESYVELLGTWGMIIMSFYFGGRSWEKIAQIKSKNN